MSDAEEPIPARALPADWPTAPHATWTTASGAQLAAPAAPQAHTLAAADVRAPFGLDAPEAPTAPAAPARLVATDLSDPGGDVSGGAPWETSVAPTHYYVPSRVTVSAPTPVEANPGPSYGWGPLPVAALAPTPAVGGASVTPSVAPAAGDASWATAAHWLPLVSHWIGPLVVLLTVGRRSDRVRAEAAASLNWEITVALVLAIAALVAKIGVLAPALAIAIVGLSVVLHVTGAVTVARGGSYTYPLALPIVR